MSHGGRRSGSGRKKGSRTLVPDYPKKPEAASAFTIGGWANELKAKVKRSRAVRAELEGL